MLKAVQHDDGVTVLDLNAADMVIRFESNKTRDQLVRDISQEYDPYAASPLEG
jgi:hypothetical protein